MIEWRKYKEEIENSEIESYQIAQLSNELLIILYDNNEATLVFDKTDIATFEWNEKRAQIFENIHEVKAVKLFETIAE